MRMMIKAVVRTVKQKSLLSKKCLLQLLTFNDLNQGRVPLEKIQALIVAQSHSLWTWRDKGNVSKNPEMDSSAFQKYLCEKPARTVNGRQVYFSRTHAQTNSLIVNL